MTEHRTPGSGSPARILAALVMTLLALVGTASAAGAATTPDFSAQAHGLGLTGAQAKSLQERVDAYLATTGGTQVSANKIALNGGELLLALPGEQKARSVTAAGDATSLAASCPYTYVCAYSGRNYTGDVLTLFTCNFPVSIPWYGTGSWINNQRAALHAKFYDRNGNLGWTSPGGYSSDPAAPWGWVGWLSPC
ncbi:peptidase inhibitor family I36 protein [Kitasatospora sp. NPDC090091]|uniref:peptidase inhibitor family I36 protein n=1 Tax=Kitasatospora sp. NPDC090091 TaxID=3364081 RepID=UPI0038054012